MNGLFFSLALFGVKLNGINEKWIKIGIRSSCFTRRAAALLYHCDLFLHLFFSLQLNVNTNSSILPHIRPFKSLKIETSSPLIRSNVSSNAFDFFELDSWWSRKNMYIWLRIWNDVQSVNKQLFLIYWKMINQHHCNSL